MITVASLPSSDFFSKGAMTPDSRKAAISAVIQGWNLQTVAKPWEDQIRPDLKDSDRLQNVMKVFNGRVKEITEFCDDRIKDMNKELADRVDALSRIFIKIDAKFDQQGNIRDVKEEGIKLVSHVAAAELDSEAVVLASEARLKAIQKERDIRMKCLGQNRFKRQAQLDQEEAMKQAHATHDETVRQIREIQYRVRSFFADFYVMKTKNTVWNDPQAGIEEIDFMDTDLPTLFNEDTRKAFFEKKEEATPFFIFLTVCWYTYLTKKALPWFFHHDLRREIQCLRSESLSDDLSISSIRGEKLFADFIKFNSLSCSLKDNPFLGRLLKVSDKILR